MALPAGAVLDLARVMEDAVVERVGDYAEDFETLYRDEAPRDTGRLAASLLSIVYSDGPGRVVMHLEVDDERAPHGKWIDQPVDEIVPVRAKALHWFGKGGDEHFSQRVVPSRVHEGWWMDYVRLGVANLGR